MKFERVPLLLLGGSMCLGMYVYKVCVLYRQRYILTVHVEMYPSLCPRTHVTQVHKHIQSICVCTNIDIALKVPGEIPSNRNEVV